MNRKYTDEEHQQWLTRAYSDIKEKYVKLKEECAEKGRENAILNDKYLEALRKIKFLEAETPDNLLARIHGMTGKIEVLEKQLVENEQMSDKIIWYDKK